MAQDEANAIRQAIAIWHERLRDVQVHRHGRGQNGTNADAEEGRSTAVTEAAEQLAACLEDKQLPDGLIDDILGVCETFVHMCEVPADTLVSSGSVRSGSFRAPLNPAKLKLLKTATGLPVHTTSIGRRASASYCVYESMGGWETLSAAVESLYTRMRGDSRVAALFEEANEQSLKTHMVEFLTCALGGKARFTSSDLLTNQRDQLRSDGFGAGQFDILLQHMKAVLEELGLQQEVAASAIALLRCHKYLFEKRAPEAADDEAGAAGFEHS